MIKQKLLELAIEHQMGMYWDAGVMHLMLRVVTGENQYGQQTSRILASVEKLGEALRISQQIYSRGGHLDAKTLLDLDVKWRFGLNESDEFELCNQVRDLYRAREYQLFQPRWEDFRAATKGR